MAYQKVAKKKWETPDLIAARSEAVRLHTTLKYSTVEIEKAVMCHVEWEEFNTPLLQKYGVELSICPIAGQGSSCWSSMAVFSFPKEAPRIQTTLDEKESKVSEYRKTCQTVWLLIIADRNFFSSAFSFEPNLLRITFQSSFDRVFLLDEPQNSIYEFKRE